MTKLTSGQKAVLEALDAFDGAGLDDAGLAVYVHHIASNDMSSSGVRTRRSELQRKGYVTVCGSRRTKSGRQARVHRITARGRKSLARAV